MPNKAQYYYGWSKTPFQNVPDCRDNPGREHREE
jgi:hypothetical protein